MKLITPFSKIICDTRLDLSDDDYRRIEEYLPQLELFQRTDNSMAITTPSTEEHLIAVGSKNRFILDHEPLLFLKDKIMEQFNIFKNDYMRYTKNDFIINTSWYTYSQPNAGAGFHMHTNCMFSGVFYIKVPENSGDIIFDPHSDRRFSPVPQDYNIYNATSWRITPQRGQLLFFDSSIYHKIDFNNSKDTRISLAFNMLPIGEIGEADSYLKIG